MSFCDGLRRIAIFTPKAAGAGPFNINARVFETIASTPGAYPLVILSKLRI